MENSIGGKKFVERRRFLAFRREKKVKDYGEAETGKLKGREKRGEEKGKTKVKGEKIL